ncbi:MAG: RNA polymerase subunit sigma-24 [Bradyrhizobiaceae bacterium PARB1]|nr:MAG: RNA polymerase subunit sigma-24 [Bradyrhizobiaceae bacterium PARB1]
MIKAGPVKLRDVLIRDYRGLKDRLMRRFGSADLATEILHETYLRLGQDKADSGQEIRNVDAYLYRTALNVAADARSRDRRWVDKATVEAVRRQDEHELDPEEILQAQQEWRELLVALNELPQRRRDIFLAVRLDGMSRIEVAGKFGVSTDTVDRELKQAFDYFAGRQEKIRQNQRGNRGFEPS